MPKVRIKQTPRPGQFIPQMDSLGEEIRGTSKKFKKGGKTRTNSNSDQSYPFQRDQGYMYEDQARDMGGVIEKMHVPNMNTNMYFNGGPINGVLRYDQNSYNDGGLYDQNLIGNITNPEHYTNSDYNQYKKGGWLKGAVNPAHKGYCTPMSKSTCTGHRRAFALTMKKHHGFHKKEDGGNIDDGPGKQPKQPSVPTPRSASNPYGPRYLFTGITSPHSQDDSLYYSKVYSTTLKRDPNYKNFITDQLNVLNNDKSSNLDRQDALRLSKIANNAMIDGLSTLSSHKGGGIIHSFKQGGKYIGAGPNTDLNPTTNHSIADYNPYVYFKNKNWYITSNPEDDKITESVKPIDREDANIEAEKGEYMVKPGLTGLYKVTGKTHAEGGTPLYAEGGSFIFSNDPKLSINKNERESFGFKGGSSSSKSKNTPAMVLGREVNPKEYNGYLATLENPDTDRIAKTTAGLMLEKFQQKLGQIAYLQENKKGTKPPDFSQGTAPVTQPQFQDIDEKMSEYKLGGYAGGGDIDPNTGLPIDSRDQYPGGRTTLGRITPKGLSNNFNYPGGVPSLIKDWQGAGIDLTNMDSREAQNAMYGWAQKNNPQLIRNMWNQYGNTARGKQYGLNYDYDNLNDKQLGRAGDAYADGMLGARTFAPIQGHTPPGPYTPGLARPDQPNVQAPPPGQPAQPINNQPSNPTLPYQIKGKLTDSQIANLGYLGLQSLNINRYMPTRQQVSLPQVKLDQINAQPYVNQVNNQAHEAYQLAALNPKTSSLMGSNIRGTVIDQANQAIGNVANQNSQIGNQQNLTNLQQMTQQVMANSQFNNQYYNEVQATNQNFDNERRFASNQFVSNLNNYQSQADKLAWQMASVNRYGTRTVTDPKTGKQYNLPTPLYETNKNGIQYNGDVANINMASGANRINTPQEIANIYKQFKDSGMPDVEAQRIVSAIIRSRTTKGTENQGPFFMQNPYGMGQ